VNLYIIWHTGWPKAQQNRAVCDWFIVSPLCDERVCSYIKEERHLTEKTIAQGTRGDHNAPEGRHARLIQVGSGGPAL